jgi:hypothetical protein
MTRTSRLLGALVLVLVLVACGARTDGLDRTKLPEDIKSDYDVFARKCSKCHSLARPIQSGITDDEQWVLYVNRMRRQPGSGIDYGDQERILRFLKYYAAELRAKEAAKKGAPAPATASDAAAPPPPVQGPAVVDEPKDGG